MDSHIVTPRRTKVPPFPSPSSPFRRPIPRKPRAVSSPQQVSAASEVPIVEESYAVRRNKTNAATDERIAKLLLKKIGPTMHYDWTEKSANER